MHATSVPLLHAHMPHWALASNGDSRPEVPSTPLPPLYMLKKKKPK
jgi:hypothetical protein